MWTMSQDTEGLCGGSGHGGRFSLAECRSFSLCEKDAEVKSWAGRDHDALIPESSTDCDSN